jgi:hypothetical protein
MNVLSLYNASFGSKNCPRIEATANSVVWNGIG